MHSVVLRFFNTKNENVILYLFYLSFFNTKNENVIFYLFYLNIYVPESCQNHLFGVTLWGNSEFKYGQYTDIQFDFFYM